MCKWYLMISFTHSRLYKDIGSKAFFTMATLLMPLLENVLFFQEWSRYAHYWKFWYVNQFSFLFCNTFSYDISFPHSGLSIDQAKVQMAIWSVLAAPLIMSNDLRTIRPEFLEILANPMAVRVNQAS